MNIIPLTRSRLSRWQFVLHLRCEPFALDILVRIAISLAASIAISLLTYIATGSPPDPQFADVKRTNFHGYAFFAVFMAPLLENLVVVAVIGVLARKLAISHAVLIAATVAAVAHLQSGTVVVVGAFLAFILFGATFLAYRAFGWWAAYMSSVLVHAGHNLVSVALSFLALTSGDL